MIVFKRKFIQPQLNIFLSDHKVERTIKIDSSYEKNWTWFYDEDTHERKKIILAGTVLWEGSTTPLGIFSNDVDITTGSANAAICIHGIINSNYMPILPETSVKNTLKQMLFIQTAHDKDPVLSCDVQEVIVGETDIVEVLVQIDNARFLPLAQSIASDVWILSNGAVLQSAHMVNEKLMLLKIGIGTITKTCEITATIHYQVNSAKKQPGTITIAKIVTPTNENIKKLRSKKGVIIQDVSEII